MTRKLKRELSQSNKNEIIEISDSFENSSKKETDENVCIIETDLL